MGISWQINWIREIQSWLYRIIIWWTPMSDLKEKQTCRFASKLVGLIGYPNTRISGRFWYKQHPKWSVWGLWRRVFRPESNQTLAHFKFRNMKQKASQMCDAYMSEAKTRTARVQVLKWLLMNCLKDQFILGIYNKEIQDHLLGEIKETDNSVRSLYEARKI